MLYTLKVGVCKPALLLIVIVILPWPRPVKAAEPIVAIIIDDVGYDFHHGRRAIELRHPFAYAVLPFSPHAEKLARYAHDLDKDVIVHLPMEAQDHNHLLGPVALKMEMTRSEFTQTVDTLINAVPYAIGVNNHMGSRLTAEPSRMQWLMSVIKNRGGLFFVDSRTTAKSVARQTARDNAVNTVSRDVFVDNNKNEVHITAQLQRLVERAKLQGRALAIAHPHPTTINMLNEWNPNALGVRLVRLREYVSEADTTVAGIWQPELLR